MNGSLNPSLIDMSHWTHRYWDIECLYPLLAETRFLHGKLIGKMSSLDPALQQEAILEVLTQDIVSSAELEGENFTADQVKSAIEKWKNHSLGSSHDQTQLDAIVCTLLDFTGHGSSQSTAGNSGLNRSEVIHPSYVQHIFSWVSQEDSIDPFIKSAIAHLWVLTDVETSDLQTKGGPTKGVLARAISDSLIPQKYYSLSTQILKEKPYYESVLERTLSNPHDISEWNEWFLYCLKSAIEASETHLAAILFKHEFWAQHAIQIDSDRQRQILEMLLKGYSDKLTTTVWAEMTGCSQDTALRDIQDLIDKEILEKLPGGGRSTAYALKDSPVGYAS